MGTTVVTTFSLIPVDVVQLPDGVDIQAIATAYRGHAEVAYVEPNYIYHIDPAGSPLTNDAHVPDLSALHTTGQSQTGSPNVIVGIIDTGIDYHHSDLRANLWLNTAEAHGRPGFDDDGSGIVDDLYGARWTNGTGVPTSGDPFDDFYNKRQSGSDRNGIKLVVIPCLTDRNR